MANLVKPKLIVQLEQEFGKSRLLPNSKSLLSFGDDSLFIYLRYSKIHPGGRTFFGLRDADLRQLEGRNSFVCLFSDSAREPIYIPFVDFEEIFRDLETASDGQYKVQLCDESDAELYIARAGKFNVEPFRGLFAIRQSLERHQFNPLVDYSHEQIQTLLAAIGNAKGYDVYVPPRDALGLDWSLTPEFRLRQNIPDGFSSAANILQEIDVVWTVAGSNEIRGLLEVEHSTPVYSGLLRFNDLLLTQRRLERFHIVSNDSRRELFSRQVLRPTFRASGLSEIVSFLDYANVAAWYERFKRS